MAALQQGHVLRHHVGRGDQLPDVALIQDGHLAEVQLPQQTAPDLLPTQGGPGAGKGQRPECPAQPQRPHGAARGTEEEGRSRQTCPPRRLQEGPRGLCGGPGWASFIASPGTGLGWREGGHTPRTSWELSGQTGPGASRRGPSRTGTKACLHATPAWGLQPLLSGQLSDHFSAC